MSSSVVRAFQIIEHLADQEGAVALKKISEDLGMEPSTVHRYLTTLKKLGYAQQYQQSQHYSLSLKFGMIHSKVISRVRIPSIAHAEMTRLSESLNETIHLAVLDNTEFVYVDKVESRQPIQMRSRIGDRGRLHSTAIGKVLLAFLPDEERRELLERLELMALTPNTLTTQKRLKQELRAVRERFYSVDNEENEIGIRCVGAPVLGFEGKLCAAVSASGSTLTMTEERLQQVAADLLRSCQVISNELGYQYDSGIWKEGTRISGFGSSD